MCHGIICHKCHGNRLFACIVVVDVEHREKENQTVCYIHTFSRKGMVSYKSSALARMEEDKSIVVVVDDNDDNDDDDDKEDGLSICVVLFA